MKKSHAQCRLEWINRMLENGCDIHFICHEPHIILENSRWRKCKEMGFDVVTVKPYGRANKDHLMLRRKGPWEPMRYGALKAIKRNRKENIQ